MLIYGTWNQSDLSRPFQLSRIQDISALKHGIELLTSLIQTLLPTRKLPFNPRKVEIVEMSACKISGRRESCGPDVCAYYLPDFIDNLILPKPPSPETSSGQPRQWGPYNDSDCSADGSTSRSYNLHVADEILVDLNNRLRSPCLEVSLNSIRLYK